MATRLGRVLRPRRSDGRRPVDGPVPGFDERLWLDGDDVPVAARERTGDAGYQRHAEELATAGITKVEGAIPTELCDRVRAEYEAYCDAHADEAAVFADASGFRSRLANFHLSSAAALAIGADPGVMALLDYLFGYRAAIYSSLVFERGTQQKIHRDTPYFCTEPPQFFFGVWTALEDVRPDAGPLVYLPGAHSIAIDQYTLAGGVHYTNAQQPDEVPLDPGTVYNETVVRLAADRGIAPTTMAASKGDTLIWHPELPHGGSPITSPTATRASIVFHCAPEGVPVFGPDRFFDADRSPNREPLRYRFAADRAYLDLGRPRFEPNHD
jgi:ectoine hydroxylase-related dioxygenase (phytanoyl-CoA dioxygenase family)